MAIVIERIKTENYRALADVTVELRDVNVLFGPNGSGKSTFLDVLWFIRDCAVRGAGEAFATRNHGIGVLSDGVEEGARLAPTVETPHAAPCLAPQGEHGAAGSVIGVDADHPSYATAFATTSRVIRSSRSYPSGIGLSPA